ncbi:hypothetical protein NO932_02565 [Pelagibacterium sp. 26DY04]|uniref:hypothetical protein n=1 Tax=Pelagibacterium sp. 26DY04 TaxID=2967130 RepID=UPI002814C8C3|nr:hypothetical protein [Pelagibacterium sp. 26DY04]WMT87504.1 hypothetical protein NO932_02565 [Pelagibacterium sp. 26DY04]
MTKRFPLSISAIALSLALAPATGFAQYSGDPFFENTVALSQAYGLESIGLGLDLASEFEAPYDDELVETVEGITGASLERFEGTLATTDAELAQNLRAALEAVAKAAEAGEDTSASVEEARALLIQAYDVVIPENLRGTPAFTGGVMIQLLLAEGGVAEGYEEAAEGNEPWEYPNGWVALQRVKALWSEIEADASEQQVADAQEMFETLDGLYPQAQPPESVAGWNPEEAEAPAQRLGGIVETVVDANLYPGRDAARLAGHISALASEACAAYGENEAVARETLYALYDLYDGELAGVASLFVPEDEETASDMFGALIGTGDDDDDEEGAEDTEVEGDDDDAGLSGGDACSALQTALTNIQGAFGA